MALSLREMQVFNLLEKDYTLKQIAIRLNVSRGTVKKKKKRIYKKLKINKRSDRI